MAAADEIPDGVNPSDDILCNLRSGMYLFLTNQWRQSELVFQWCQQHCPSDDERPIAWEPVAALLKCFAGFVSGMTTYGEAELAKSLSAIWAAEALANQSKHHKSKHKKLSAQLVQGFCYMLGSLVQVAQQSFVKCAWNLRKSWGFFSGCEKQVEAYQGPDKAELEGMYFFGLGIFNLMVSLLPPHIVSIASWLGFSGDRELAISSLRKCRQSGGVVAPLAALLLVDYFVLIAPFTGTQTKEHLAEARTILDETCRSFPEGIFFLWMEARYHRCTKDLLQSMQFSERARQVCQQQRPELKLFSNYQFSWAHMLQLHFEPAAEYWLELYHDDGELAKSSFQAFYCYTSALCLAAHAQTLDKGSPERSVADATANKRFGLVESAVKSAKKYPIESYARRKARDWLAGYGRPELDLLEIVVLWNALSNMPDDKLASSLSMLHSAKERHFSTDNQSNSSGDSDPSRWTSGDLARYHVLCASIHHCQQQDEDALRQCDLALGLESQIDSRAKADGVLPLACFQKTIIYLSRAQQQSSSEDVKLARKFFKKSSSFKGFTMEKRLNFRLHSLEQDIKMAEKAHKH